MVAVKTGKRDTLLLISFLCVWFIHPMMLCFADAKRSKQTTKRSRWSWLAFRRKKVSTFRPPTFLLLLAVCLGCHSHEQKFLQGWKQPSNQDSLSKQFRNPHHSFDLQQDSISTRRRLLRRATLWGAAWTTTMSPALSKPTIAVPSSSPDPVLFDALPQFYTVADIPQYYFQDHRYIFGFVERVIDGDTVRVRHVPGYGMGRKIPEPLNQRGIANETLSIRLYAIDAPETGKNKRKTSQPFGEEATAFISDMVFQDMVRITLLRRDQYGRAVAQVETISNSPFSGSKDLSMELAKAGLAELYTGGGAEYNGQKNKFEDVIAQARRRRKGIWSLGDDFVSASQYKREKKQQNTSNRPVASGAGNGVLPKGLAFATTSGAPTKAEASRQRTTLWGVPKHHSRTNANPTVASALMDVAVTGLEIAVG